MNQDRRVQLQTELNAAHALAATDTSRMSVLCTWATTQLSVSGVGATVLAHDGDGQGQQTRRGLVHATNEISAGLEDLQLTVGEGPCLDAFATGGPVLVADLSIATARWPGFAPGALQLGAAGVFSFPLHIGVYQLGSLDCYRDSTQSLSQIELTDALLVAELATHAVLDELDGHSSGDVSWLADPHAEIHQATGMVQVQLETTTATALLRLRGHAYTHQLSLAVVARQVTTRALHFSPDSDAQPESI